LLSRGGTSAPSVRASSKKNASVVLAMIAGFLLAALVTAAYLFWRAFAAG
jgi:hypothetical protein